jgi:hypothetical protein
MSGARVNLVSYATRPFEAAQRLNTSSAEQIGGFARISAHSPRDIDADFCAANHKLLRASRGGGHWLWKPYLINRHLRELDADEWLFYCDAGAYFVHSVAPLVEHALEHELGVVVFELEPHLIEQEWTKRDAFVLLGADASEFRCSPQRLGGFSLWRASDAAFELAESWLRHACDPRLVSDKPNTCGLPNHAGFRAHRHDQSLLSLLSKQRAIPAWRDPSQFGNPRIGDDPRCRYPQIVESTRMRTVSIARKLAWKLRRRRSS